MRRHLIIGGAAVPDQNIPVNERLIFAMDVPDCDRARQLAEELGDSVIFYKLGLELMMSGGYFELLDWMLARDKKVFADLKFYDIPATVGSAVRQLKDRGASFVTVHGDKSIMEAAAENKGDDLKVLVVTVLTSLDRSDLGDLGLDCDVGELVLLRAKLAFETGCDGVISSGLEAAKLRRDAGHSSGRQQAERRSEACGQRRAGIQERRGLHRGRAPNTRCRKPACRRRVDPGDHRRGVLTR
jgi:orotidine-5'-phosphate decarboxylase